jgi:hypothetical protein
MPSGKPVYKDIYMIFEVVVEIEPGHTGDDCGFPNEVFRGWIYASNCLGFSR